MDETSIQQLSRLPYLQSRKPSLDSTPVQIASVSYDRTGLSRAGMLRVSSEHGEIIHVHGRFIGEGNQEFLIGYKVNPHPFPRLSRREIALNDIRRYRTYMAPIPITP